MKILWLDSETGGLNPRKNPILTLAGIIEMNGSPVEEFYFKVKPFTGQTVEDTALKVNGITREEIEKFEDPLIVHNKLNITLGKYCNKYDRNDKYILAGHNIAYDLGMLKVFYELCGDSYLYSWVDYHVLDTMALAIALKQFGNISPLNVKLETLAKYFNIPLTAHNALNDIRATREVFYRFKQYIKEPTVI